MIRQSFELNAIACGMCKPAREARPVGKEERDVIEPRMTFHRLGPLLLDEADDLRVRSERGTPAVALEHTEPDDVQPVVERAVEIGDGELDRSHARRRSDLHQLDDSAVTLHCA